MVRERESPTSCSMHMLHWVRVVHGCILAAWRAGSRSRLREPSIHTITRRCERSVAARARLNHRPRLNHAYICRAPASTMRTYAVAAPQTNALDNNMRMGMCAARHSQRVTDIHNVLGIHTHGVHTAWHSHRQGPYQSAPGSC